jgi:hypothetical protein
MKSLAGRDKLSRAGAGSLNHALLADGKCHEQRVDDGERHYDEERDRCLVVSIDRSLFVQQIATQQDKCEVR